LWNPPYSQSKGIAFKECLYDVVISAQALNIFSLPHDTIIVANHGELVASYIGELKKAKTEQDIIKLI
jgi:hypothetical protein